MKTALSLALLACSGAAIDSEVLNLAQKYKGADFQTNRYTLKSGPPEQVHIAYAGKSADGYPTGINVAWVFADNTACSVKYGKDKGSLTETAAAGPGARYLHEGGYHYNVDVLGLPALTKYYYAVECKDLTSEMYSFTTAADGALPRPFNINIFGDMGYLGSAERPMYVDVGGLKKHWSAVPTRAMQQKMYESGQTDMMWIVGDVGYADDAFAHDVVGGLYEKAYDGYMNWMQNITANIPSHVSVGNHESECHSPECVLDVFLGEKLANFSAYNSRFHMPSKVSGGVMNMWYSWNVGPVHFISINTETDFPGAGEEKRGDSDIFRAGGFGRTGEYMAWLEADLEQALADKKSGKRPFIVLGGHRPCCQPEVLLSLLDKYEVDFFIAGHKHSYGRSLKSCQKPACHAKTTTPYSHNTTHVYCGGAGNEEMGINTSGPVANSTQVTFATDELSTGWLTIQNNTALRWRLVSSQDETRILDEFWLHAWN